MNIASYEHKVPDQSYGEPQEDATRDFYVSVRDAGRTGLLLGPYATHMEALDNVTRGKALAQEANWKAAFYAFGTCSLPKGMAARVVFAA